MLVKAHESSLESSFVHLIVLRKIHFTDLNIVEGVGFQYLGQRTRKQTVLHFLHLLNVYETFLVPEPLINHLLICSVLYSIGTELVELSHAAQGSNLLLICVYMYLCVCVFSIL